MINHLKLDTTTTYFLFKNGVSAQYNRFWWSAGAYGHDDENFC